MERAQVSIGRLELERLDRSWTQEYVAAQLGIDAATVRRWERGLHKPQPILRQKLCKLFGKTAQELGLIDDEVARESAPGEQTRLEVSLSAPVADSYTAFREGDLTTRLQSLVWEWLLCSINARYHGLQDILVLKLGDNSMNDDLISRRQALRRLASVPIEVCGLSLVGPILKRSLDEILVHCAAGITACWYLRQGTDLTFVFDTLSRYIPTLQEIALSGSAVQRKDSAELLAQCFILQSTLAWHLRRSSDGSTEAEQAKEYAKDAGNPLLQIIALRTQSVAYRFSNRWKLALDTALQAKYLLQTAEIEIAPRVQSYVYGGLAVYQAHEGQKQDALRSLGKAHETFFQTSAHALVPLPVEMYHEQANLILSDGLTHLYLELYQEAFDSFAQITTLSDKSEINRTEALINQALAEASSEEKEPDMHRCIALWTQGIEGAKALRSTQRFNEATIAYATMCGVWRKEKAIKDLRGLVVWPDEKSHMN